MNLILIAVQKIKLNTHYNTVISKDPCREQGRARKFTLLYSDSLPLFPLFERKLKPVKSSSIVIRQRNVFLIIDQTKRIETRTGARAICSWLKTAKEGIIIFGVSRVPSSVINSFGRASSEFDLGFCSKEKIKYTLKHGHFQRTLQRAGGGS